MGLPLLETVETIDANHMEMARCVSRNDSPYQAIVGVLKQFMGSGIASNGRFRPQGDIPATQAESQGEPSAGGIGAQPTG